MTEAEAKTKWCPMVRFHCANDGSIWDNKPPGEFAANNRSAFCIGSACMMWRLERPRFVEAEESAGPSGQFKTAVYKPGDGDGYCGLAVTS